MAKLCVSFVLVLVVIHANAHKVPSDDGHSAPEVATLSGTKVGVGGYAGVGGHAVLEV